MSKARLKVDPAQAFMQLLEDCYQQVREDPSSIADNPHLYDALHHVYTQLCHGDIRQAEADRE